MPLRLHLHGTNQRMGSWLDHVLAQQGRPALVSPEQMATLLSELLGAGAALRAEPIPAKGNDLELDAELETYRGQVERLRELLPSIHRQLLAERVRIEGQRSRVQSVAAWARASRQTL